MDYEELLNTATDIGFLLLENGAEIYRVEESVQRILTAYGVPEADVFAIPTCLITTLYVDGKAHTRLRRVNSRTTDLDRVQQYNDLCRTVCRTTPSPEEVEERIAEIKRRPVYGLKWQMAGYALTGGSFALFFGGTLRDALCALVISALLRLLVMPMEKLHTNSFFISLVGSGLGAALAIAAVSLGAGQNLDKIIIGFLMNLVPGVALTNAIRDIIAGDLVAGVTRLTEALLTAVAMALGAGIALSIMHMAGGL